MSIDMSCSSDKFCQTVRLFRWNFYLRLIGIVDKSSLVPVKHKPTPGKWFELVDYFSSSSSLSSSSLSSSSLSSSPLSSSSPIPSFEPGALFAQITSAAATVDHNVLAQLNLGNW